MHAASQQYEFYNVKIFLYFLKRFDTDRSGTIDAQELNVAFSSFGYRL
jgi:Ca2+-binding EF-hand superfamily protein